MEVASACHTGTQLRSNDLGKSGHVHHSVLVLFVYTLVYAMYDSCKYIHLALYT